MSNDQYSEAIDTIELRQGKDGTWQAVSLTKPLSAIGRTQEEALQLIGRTLDQRK